MKKALIIVEVVLKALYFLSFLCIVSCYSNIVCFMYYNSQYMIRILAYDI